MDRSIGFAFGTVLAVCGVAVACGQGTSGDVGEQMSAQVENDAASTNDGGADAATAADIAEPRLAVCSDGQVVAILHVANVGEVTVAQAVRDRLTDENVRAFAERMITEHSKLDSDLMALGISPEENEIGKELEEGARQAVQSLGSKSGTELDSSFITHEVIDHLEVLGMADHLLAPSIENPQLAAAASTARAAVAEHARASSELQTSVAGACGGGSSSDGGTSNGDGGAANGDGGTSGGDGGGTTSDGGDGGGGGGEGGRTY